VLCYGWDANPVRLYLYDPNNPDEESVLTPVSAAAGCRVVGARTGRTSTYRGYFLTNVYNWSESPPYRPPYRDLTITSGLDLSIGSTANVGVPLQLGVTVQNVGEYPSRFRAFVIWARDPSGRNVDASVGGIEGGFTSLGPGQTRTIARSVASFGSVRGSHTIGVSKESSKGHWQSVPPSTQGTVSTRTVVLWPAKAKLPDVWRSVPEDSADVDTGVVLEPGDELALSAGGSVWSGVWLTGLNGPEGWTDRIETNPAFPLNNVPDARPFSLVGRIGSGGYFYVGTGLGRRTVSNSTPERLYLRVNDNVPANGSGAFQCLIEVWR
jgi:hypothetical protein